MAKLLKKHSAPFQKLGQFSKLFLDYLENNELKEFYHRFPSKESFKAQIEERQFDHRPVLVEALQRQNKGVLDRSVSKNIELLKHDNTFTITTGHQLCLFTGPVYFVYKIVSVIKACLELKNAYPDYNFVPVFWMASEDHDYDEIKSTLIHQKNYTWTTDQQGAVGRFSLKDFSLELNDSSGLDPEILSFYQSSDTLSEATRKLVSHLFMDKGLVIIDGDDDQLKSLFTPYVKREITESVSEGIVSSASARLEELGYNSQVFPRAINLFHLQDSSRRRLEILGDLLKEVEGDWSIALSDLDDYLKKHPERISPNVILRPLYQEVVLPNLAYVGGPGENAYWLQLKGVFNANQVSFPILLPRMHAGLVDSLVKKKSAQLNLAYTDFSKGFDALSKELITSRTDYESLEKEITEAQGLFKEIEKKASKVDPTLGPNVQSEWTRELKRLGHIQKKMEKAYKLKSQVDLDRLSIVLDRLFPKGGLQERKHNVFSYGNPKEFIEQLVQICEPFTFDFNWIEINE